MAAPCVTADSKPLAVWDANTWHKWPLWREANAWATEHIRDINDVYRAEIHMVDAPFAVLYRYALDDRGYRYFDPETNNAAVVGPAVQLLDALPPSHLLGAH